MFHGKEWLRNHTEKLWKKLLNITFLMKSIHSNRKHTDKTMHTRVYDFTFGGLQIIIFWDSTIITSLPPFFFLLTLSNSFSHFIWMLCIYTYMHIPKCVSATCSVSILCILGTDHLVLSNWLVCSSLRNTTSLVPSIPKLPVFLCTYR